jgi:hypothetical protein
MKFLAKNYRINSLMMSDIQRLITVMGWFLVAAAGGLLFSHFISAASSDTLKSTAFLAGVLVALGANLLTQAKNLADSNEKKSAFYLESAIKAYEQAKSLIQDGNNDRVKWIEAARCLGHAKAFAANINIDSHQRAIELNRISYRSFFHELLATKKASFFYGASDPKLSLDKAARASMVPRNRKSLIDEASIRAVWEAAQYPSDYEDLSNESFSESERSKLSVKFPELHKYLQHRHKI